MLGISYTAGSWNLGSLTFYNADMIAKEEKMYQKICLELEQQLAQINLEYNSIVNSIRPDDDLYCDAGGSDANIDTEKKSNNFFQWLFDKGIWLDFPGCGPSIGGLMAQGYSEDEALGLYTEHGLATGIGSLIAISCYGCIFGGAYVGANVFKVSTMAPLGMKNGFHIFNLGYHWLGKSSLRGMFTLLGGSGKYLHINMNLPIKGYSHINHWIIHPNVINAIIKYGIEVLKGLK